MFVFFISFAFIINEAIMIVVDVNEAHLYIRVIYYIILLKSEKVEARVFRQFHRQDVQKATSHR